MNIPEYKIARAVELLRSLDYTLRLEDESRQKRGIIGEVLDILDPVKPERDGLEMWFFNYRGLYGLGNHERDEEVNRQTEPGGYRERACRHAI
jgi:hypothetical protein